MIGVIVASRKLNVNPDNVATPIAASLGDLVTLAILAHSAKTVHDLRNGHLAAEWTYPGMILACYAILVVPFCIKNAQECTSTHSLLKNGWTPGKKNVIS